ncbi:MAG: EAL domain-containing protein [Curvibacter sp.]|nr:EAL domain-containing protein [Curvibacter sp.]
MTWHQLDTEQQRLRDEAGIRTVEQARAFGEYTRASVRRLSEFLLDLRANWLVSPSAFRQALVERQSVVKDISFQMAVIDRQGRLLYSSLTQDIPMTDLSNREHFKVHQRNPDQDRLFISDPVQGSVSRSWSIQFTRPIHRDGQFDGVMVLSVSPQQLARFALSLDIGPHDAAALIKDSGVVLARYPEKKGSVGRQLDHSPYFLRGDANQGNFSGNAEIDGQERIYGYYRLPDLGLNFVVGRAVDSAMLTYQGLRRSALASALAMSLLLLALHHVVRHLLSERRQALEQQRFAALVYGATSEAMVVTHASGWIVDINPAFSVATGYNREEALGGAAGMIRSPRNPDSLIKSLYDSVRHTGSWHGEYLIQRKDGSEYPALMTIDTLKDPDLAHPRRVILFRDITQTRQQEALIWRQANFDPLTQLPNRRLFTETLQQELEKARHGHKAMAVLFLDLDRFKEVNDTLGHGQGDLLLQMVAQRLRDGVRSDDLVARMGGDEFTILLTGLQEDEEPPELRPLVDQLLQRIAAPYQLSTELVFVSASIGVTLCPRDGNDVESLLMQADQAMFAAKNSGRNRWQFFKPELRQAAQDRLRLANDLRLALDNRQIFVHYQPIVDLRSGRVCKAEALMRWRHPVKGLISPADFIPVAEETGMIIDMGQLVMHDALEQLARCRQAGHPAFQISVNRSPIEFRADQRHAEPWLQALERRQLPPQSLILEITEGLLMTHEPEVQTHLRRFTDAHVPVAIDDFGTGYSSLAYLKRFQIDLVKIDQSFVRDLPDNPESLALCRAIISMAHELQLRVVAEGIETEAQRQALCAAGCDFGQGFLFARPQSGEALEALLAATAPHLPQD